MTIECDILSASALFVNEKKIIEKRVKIKTIVST